MREGSTHAVIFILVRVGASVPSAPLKCIHKIRYSYAAYFKRSFYAMFIRESPPYPVPQLPWMGKILSARLRVPRSLAWEGWKENGNVADACPVMQEMADLFMWIDGPSWSVRWGSVRCVLCAVRLLVRHTERHEPKIENQNSLHFDILSLTQQNRK